MPLCNLNDLEVFKFKEEGSEPALLIRCCYFYELSNLVIEMYKVFVPCTRSERKILRVFENYAFTDILSNVIPSIS